MASARKTLDRVSAAIKGFKPKVASSEQAGLGEGACWDPITKRLLWVDIYAGKIFRHDPVTKEDSVIETFQPIGTVVPYTKKHVVAALLKGICVIDVRQKKVIEYIGNPEAQNVFTRWNDGKVCPFDGRLWVGSMGILKQEGFGSLYSVDTEKKIKTHLSDLTISNGICWSLDGSTMYHIDTPTHTVCAFDYDAKQGSISKKRVVVTVKEDMGAPDGMTIDNEGKLWVALFGGSAVARYDPENGTLIAKIKLPVEQSTSVAFGGDNLDQLYITTGAEGFTKKDYKNQPKAGCLFQVDMSKTTIRGVASGVFKSETALDHKL